MTLTLSRTPLRITLGGGGTDIPKFYTSHPQGGMWISGCIDKFIYVIVKERFEEPIHIKYSMFETITNIEEIKHPIIREVLHELNVKSHVEIICLADLPSRTGLGSSGAFTVGLYNALMNFLNMEIYNPNSLAEYSYHVERVKLKRPVGKQDPYCAVYGGVRAYRVDREGFVTCAELPYSTVSRLEDCLLIVYTGTRRPSETILKRTQEHPRYMELMTRVYELGRQKLQALLIRDIEEYGRLLHEYWSLKKLFTRNMSSPFINRLYDYALEHGALGGKVMGAGGGGFMLFVCPNREVRDNLKERFTHVPDFQKRGVEVVDFIFWHKGSEVIEL